MEALDGNSRQSGISAVVNLEKTDRFNTDRSYIPSNTMAATAVMSPTSSMYSNGPAPPPYSAVWPAAGNRPVSGLVSPPESRRTSDNQHEQTSAHTTSSQLKPSLPSLRETLGSTQTSSSHTSPVPAPFLSQQTPYQHQIATAPRANPLEHKSYSQLPTASQRTASPPHPIHSQSHSFSRPEPTAFSEVQRHPPITSSQPLGPQNPYAGPLYEPARNEQEHRVQDRVSSGYPQYPASNPGSYTYGPQPQQPPFPGHQGAPLREPRYYPRDGAEHSDSWKGHHEKNESFKQGLKRHLEVYDFENSLSQINSACSSLLDWSEGYYKIAQEQQRSTNNIPDRMPDGRQCETMLHQAQTIVAMVHRMKDMVHEQEQNIIADQRMRDHGRPGAFDDDMSIYGEDAKQGAYGEGKKRRGRAAPPGRCHSCNRAETPEWRRGPDGARTLCNACGLHYAKLTRKQNSKQGTGNNGSSLRPRSIDGGDTRPPMQ